MEILLTVQTIQLDADATGMRLDRWFKAQVPTLPHARLQKLLRTGQVRVNGKRVKSNHPLKRGDMLRVPPLQKLLVEARADKQERFMRDNPITTKDKHILDQMVLHDDAAILVLNKTPGLATQGGTSTRQHVDRLLESRGRGDEKPRLVHRLDKDTSGILVVAKNRRVAQQLSAALESRDVKKVYWALVVGVPPKTEGVINIPLSKEPVGQGERVITMPPGEGREAVTRYVVKASKILGEQAFSWLELMPETGRMHQLRVHLAHIGCPIYGDGKYGKDKVKIKINGHVYPLCLHARAMTFVHPLHSRRVSYEADLPPHMQELWQTMGFGKK